MAEVDVMEAAAAAAHRVVNPGMPDNKWKKVQKEIRQARVSMSMAKSRNQDIKSHSQRLRAALEARDNAMASWMASISQGVAEIKSDVAEVKATVQNVEDKVDAQERRIEQIEAKLNVNVAGVANLPVEADPNKSTFEQILEIRGAKHRADAAMIEIRKLRWKEVQESRKKRADDKEEKSKKREEEKKVKEEKTKKREEEKAKKAEEVKAAKAKRQADVLGAVERAAPKRLRIAEVPVGEVAAELQADEVETPTDAELAAKKKSFDRLRNVEKQKRMKKLLLESGEGDELLKYAAAKKPELYNQILEEIKAAAAEAAVGEEHAEQAESNV